jgi:hypothetical protein
MTPRPPVRLALIGVGFLAETRAQLGIFALSSARTG